MIQRAFPTVWLRASRFALRASRFAELVFSQVLRSRINLRHLRKSSAKPDSCKNPLYRWYFQHHPAKRFALFAEPCEVRSRTVLKVPIIIQRAFPTVWRSALRFAELCEAGQRTFPTAWLRRADLLCQWGYTTLNFLVR